MPYQIDYSKMNYRIKTMYENTPREDWESFSWQMRNRLKTRDEIEKYLTLSPCESKAFDAFSQSEGCLNEIAITPHYMSLVDPDDQEDPLRKECIPQDFEMTTREVDMEDALAEEKHTVAPGLVHRYPDRCVFLVTPMCPVFCRFCTRNRMVAQVGDDGHAFATDYEPALEYLRKHTEVRDVLVTGGDPFTLATPVIEKIYLALRSIPNIEFIRFGTRTPVTCPMRIDESLLEFLRKYNPWISTHFNHSREAKNEYSIRACNLIADAGVPLGNQMVLLRGINDTPEKVKKLNHQLLKIRVKPYYIFQCHLQKRLGHFRTPIARGVQIIEKMRGWTSGYAVPQFIVDLPGGGGKVSVMPNYVINYEKGKGLTARNYLNEPKFTYWEEDREEDNIPENDLTKILGLKPAPSTQPCNKDFPGALDPL